MSSHRLFQCTINQLWAAVEDPSSFMTNNHKHNIKQPTAMQQMPDSEKEKEEKKDGWFSFIERWNDVWVQASPSYYYVLQCYTRFQLYINRFHPRYLLSIAGTLYAIAAVANEGAAYTSEACKTLIHAGECINSTDIGVPYTCSCDPSSLYLNGSTPNYGVDYGLCDVSFTSGAFYGLSNECPVVPGSSSPEIFFYYQSTNCFLPSNVQIRDDCPVTYGTLGTCLNFFNNSPEQSNDPTQATVERLVIFMQIFLLAEVICNYITMLVIKRYQCKNICCNICGPSFDKISAVFWRFTVGPYGVMKIIYALITCVALTFLLVNYDCSISNSNYPFPCPGSGQLITELVNSRNNIITNRVIIILKDVFHLVIMVQRIYFFRFGYVSILEKEPLLMETARKNYCRRVKLVEGKSVYFDENKVVHECEDEKNGKGGKSHVELAGSRNTGPVTNPVHS